MPDRRATAYPYVSAATCYRRVLSAGAIMRCLQRCTPSHTDVGRPATRYGSRILRDVATVAVPCCPAAQWSAPAQRDAAAETARGLRPCSGPGGWSRKRANRVAGKHAYDRPVGRQKGQRMPRAGTLQTCASMRRTFERACSASWARARQATRLRGLEVHRLAGGAACFKRCRNAKPLLRLRGARRRQAAPAAPRRALQNAVRGNGTTARQLCARSGARAILVYSCAQAQRRLLRHDSAGCSTSGEFSARSGCRWRSARVLPADWGRFA